MCQAHPGTFTCLTSICFACFAGRGGGQIALAGAGEGGGMLLLLLGERKQRGSVTTVTFTLCSVCYPAFKMFFPFLKILYTENLSVNCELYSPSPIYESPFYHHTGSQPASSGAIRYCQSTSSAESRLPKVASQPHEAPELMALRPNTAK